MHSSTVTVAVLGSFTVDVRPYHQRSADDYTIEWFSGTIGAGGQNHQKTQNCARIVHRPTGLIRTAQTRSRQNSLKLAMGAINDELDRLASHVTNAATNDSRRDQVGSGQRSDKRRTFRFQDGLVHDHVTQKSIPVDRAMNGRLDLLWPDS